MLSVLSSTKCHDVESRCFAPLGTPPPCFHFSSSCLADLITSPLPTQTPQLISFLNTFPSFYHICKQHCYEPTWPSADRPLRQTTFPARKQKQKGKMSGPGDSHHGSGGNSGVNDLLKQATQHLGSMASQTGRSRYVQCILESFSSDILSLLHPNALPSKHIQTLGGLQRD